MIMKIFRLSAYFFCFLALAFMFSDSALAQQANNDLPSRVEFESTQDFGKVPTKHLDVSGTWTGFRYQYDRQMIGYIQDFDYTFDLVQKGNSISGTSLIMSEDGNYSEVNIRGLLVDDQFYFEEFLTNDEKTAQNRVWCYKVGSLGVSVKDGALVLHGASNSFTSNNYFPCTGGYTLLERVNSDDVKPVEAAKGDDAIANSNGINVLSASPNPFILKTNLQFDVAKAGKATVEVFDLSGQQVARLFNGKLESGTHNFDFNGQDYGYNSGVFVAKLTLGNEVHSTQIIQVD